ncbi:MAG: 30S ribosomal protein S16 [Alphaproteobacteria bacterium]|nr:30S ribosomal protein S16 [Alphaproteobacteria bacterium]
MALKIRMSRAGAKKRPFYRIVVADIRCARDGRFIEKIGTFNPMVPHDHPHRLTLDIERIKHWLGVGALPSERVAKFLSAKGLCAAPKIRETPKKSAPRAKTQERLKAAAEKSGAEAPAPAAS